MTHALRHDTTNRMTCNLTAACYGSSQNALSGLRMRRPNAATREKYSEGVHMIESDLEVPLEEVALKFGLNVRSLRSFVRTWHPELLKSRRNGSTAAKYAETINAMRREPHICA